MKNIPKKLLLLIWTVLVVMLVLNQSVYAFNFQIDRAKIRVIMPPGWSDGGVITFTNKSDQPLKVKVYIGDWYYSDSSGAKNFVPPSTLANSCAEWIKFYPTEFTVSAGGSQKVNYVVGIPPDAIGGHYAVLFFEVQTGTQWNQENGVMVNVYHRLASLFYVEPEGTIKREVKITDLNIKTSGSEIELEAIFENSGNVDINTKGTFDIIDEKGFVFSRGEFNEIFTLPQDKVKIKAKGTLEGLVKGKYDIVLTFDLKPGIFVKEYELVLSDQGKIEKIIEK